MCAERDIRNELSVHHVEMQALSAGGLAFTGSRRERAEVGRKQGRRDLDRQLPLPRNAKYSLPRRIRVVPIIDADGDLGAKDFDSLRDGISFVIVLVHRSMRSVPII